MGGVVEGDWEGKSSLKFRDLQTDERCRRANHEFLISTDVGRLAPPLGDGDAGSEDGPEIGQQQMVNQQARPIPVCFPPTNPGALPTEPGPRATTQMERRQRCNCYGCLDRHFKTRRV